MDSITMHLLSEYSGTCAMISSGSVSNAELAVDSVTSAKILNGNIEAADLNASTFSEIYWKWDGNSDRTDGINFMGTTGDNPLEFRINNQLVFRLEPRSASSKLVQVANKEVALRPFTPMTGFPTLRRRHYATPHFVE